MKCGLAVRLWLILCSCFLWACGGESLPGYQSEDRRYEATYLPGNGNTQLGAEYARGVLTDDPRRTVLLDAWVRDEQLLGLVVRRGAGGEALRDIVLGLAVDMGTALGGRDAEVIAYNEGDHKAVSRATYDADTGETSYESVR